MILTSLKLPFIQKVVPLSFSQKSVVFKALQQDTFTLSDKERQKKEVETLLSKKRKFNISSYKKLSSSDIEKINETIVSRTHSAGERSVDIALDLKDYLDKTYGANNYVFCCIGTSPAGVARVFEFMGVETKYLPISGLTHVRDFEYYCNLYPDYLAFLSEQGLTKEKMEKSKKTYLFLDYTYTGNSLKVFEEMMRNEFGLDTQNSIYLSMNDILEKNAKDDEDKYFRARYYIDNYLYSPRISKYTGIPHLPIEFMHMISYKFDDDVTVNRPLARHFNFVVIDILRERGLLKENPKNKDLPF